MKKVASLAILASSLAFGQSKITAVQPSVVPSALTDYATPKALVISREGTYVCQDGYDLYVNVPDVKIKGPQPPQTRNLMYVSPGQRLISSDKQKFIPICISIK